MDIFLVGRIRGFVDSRKKRIGASTRDPIRKGWERNGAFPDHGNYFGFVGRIRSRPPVNSGGSRNIAAWHEGRFEGSFGARFHGSANHHRLPVPADQALFL